MTRIITYSLKTDAANSDSDSCGYYRTISAFADAWLAQTGPRMHDLVTGFREHCLDHGEPERSEAEYLFELLALGVLLREYREKAGHMPRWAEVLMPRLVEFQNRQPRAESSIKILRGLLGWIANLVPVKERGGDAVGSLVAWLGANEETAKEARFKRWREYFISKGEAFTLTAVSRCLELADEFAGSSREALGKYTINVERFLAEEAPQYRRRYDALLLSRTRLEYHLGMLGTEILNRAYRQRFLATRRKIVIVPPCMCAPAEECKAVETPFGAKCQACTPSCRVNQITKLGEKHDFSVTMIPDDVKIFNSGQGAESIGLVGVSCVLTNWNGGWETGALGIPAQGLLLDYVGCKIHWDKEGFPTDTNLKKLQEILRA